MTTGVSVSHVLVVDDDASIREMLRLALEDDGYVVCEAEDGLAALDLLRASQVPLVVLLDYLMPRVSGAGVLAAVAADPDLAARHAFIIVTASVVSLPPECARLAYRLGAPIVPKPFDVDALLALVDETARHLKSAVTPVAVAC